MNQHIAYYVTVVGGLASLLPAAAGLFRMQRIHPAFYPFILLISLNPIVEVTSIFMVRIAGFNTPLLNIYGILSSILIAWQLTKWMGSRAFTNGVLLATFALVLLWLSLWYYTGLETRFTLYFQAAAACITVSCFYLLYHRIPDLSFGLRKDAVVLICSAWLILYVFDFITELLISSSRLLQTPALPYLKPVFSVINLLVIFIQLIAVKWIPPKTPS